MDAGNPRAFRPNIGLNGVELCSEKKSRESWGKRDFSLWKFLKASRFVILKLGRYRTTKSRFSAEPLLYFQFEKRSKQHLNCATWNTTILRFAVYPLVLAGVYCLPMLSKIYRYPCREPFYFPFICGAFYRCRNILFSKSITYISASFGAHLCFTTSNTHRILQPGSKLTFHNFRP